MGAGYPYDETTRARVAHLLYRALPLFYRVQDQPPQGTQDLERFLRVLGSPLATLRQSIDELHANLFIDTCGDAALPLLAELVGVELVFPDADTNRRDLRGTIRRRRRKGTRPMLQELARELTEKIVGLVEGWQRLALVQHLNTLRPERTLPNVRPLTFGSSASGPLDGAHHLVDIRAITASTGRYHPRHLTHWVFVTQTFPLRDGTPVFLPDPLDPTPPDPLVPQASPDPLEWRYAIHPLGGPWGLRQRPASDDDPVRTDRILADHFAASPGQFFAREGRFEVRVAGLPAGVAQPVSDQRDPSNRLVEREIARGAVSIDLLDRPLRGWNNGRFELAVCAVPVAGSLPQTAGAVDVRSTIILGSGPSVTVNAAEPGADVVVLLRLQAIGGGGFFPGATVAVTGGRPPAARAHPDTALASSGFLAGALAVTLPATWVIGPRWFYLTADGSVFEAQDLGEGDADVNFLVSGGVRSVPAERLRAVGPGAAFPPLRRGSQLGKLTTLPAPGRGPSVLHGGQVLVGTGNPVPATTECALVFSARYLDQSFQHEPIGRLLWLGSDPANARWQLLDQTGAVVADSDIPARLTALVAFRNDGPNQMGIAARFECSVDQAVFTPAEAVWSSDDGDTILVYLPERLATPINTEAWPPTLANVSAVVQVQEDGSTRATNGGLLRVSEGRVAPLRQSVLHVRRRVKWRDLSGAPPPPDPAALRIASRCLDVDVEHGRFSLYGEAPQPWPLGPEAVAPPGFVRPPNVTVAFEDAYTGHVGARPSSRDILLFQLVPGLTELPTPTRLVSRSGVLDSSLDPAIYGDQTTPPIPRYRSVDAALQAIAGDPLATEVVRIEDDATYPNETLLWPGGVESLTILAADSRRPVLELVPSGASSASYQSLTLRGIAFGGQPLSLPPSRNVDIQFCTVTDQASRLTVPLVAGGTCRALRSVLAGVEVTGGTLNVTDCVVDAGTAGAAISSQGPLVELEGCTVVGTTSVHVLEASHCLFIGAVTVADRFHGCVRFSAVPANCLLPRRHEVVEGFDARLLSLDRHSPDHVRLSPQSPRALLSGGENGSELGAFHHLLSTQRFDAFERRLTETTPAGLVWALLRLD